MSSGLVAEFETPGAMVDAIRRMRKAGYARMDAYTPFPVPEAEEALALERSPIPKLVFGAGLTGALLAYGFQLWVNVSAYPLNVGGRPLHSGPAFIPITFETTVLFAALTAFGSVVVLGRLLRLWHPVFEADGFERASVDRFFLAVDARDSLFEERRTTDALRLAGALRVTRFPAPEEEQS